MKGTLLIFLISSVGLISLGLFLKFLSWTGGNLLLVIGLLTVAIRSVKYFLLGISKGERTIPNIFLYGLLSLMSVILFTRNLYWTFGDYPTLIVVPSFIICAVWYFLKSKKKELGLTVPTLFYALLCIPLFAFDFHGSPRKYFPDDWNDRLGEVTYEFVELPYEFRLPRVEALNDSAFSLKNIGRQEDAIQLYREAIELEPDNPKLYFGLSQSLARNNELESAIKALNMAIENDDTFSVFYSNRGLYYYKLKQAANAISDLETAIQLDSTTYWPYANLALVYAQINELEKACAFITLAEEKGMAINSEPEIKRIDEGYCKRKNR